MSDTERVDVIIVGGGIAGLSAAYALAQGGKDVLLLERGTVCGSKNMTGGRIYVHSLQELLGADTLAEAPLERGIVKEQITIISEAGSTTMDYVNTRLQEKGPQSYSLLRSVFDPWLAHKAEEAGALIVTGTPVDQLIEEKLY